MLKIFDTFESNSRIYNEMKFYELDQNSKINTEPQIKITNQLDQHNPQNYHYEFKYFVKPKSKQWGQLKNSR